jgi:FkbH-like protein
MSRRRPVTPHDLAARLGPLPFAERLTAARALCAEIEEPFLPAAADALLAQLAAQSDDERAARARWIDELPASIAGSYLQAVAYGAAGRDAEAAERWSDFFDRCPAQDPFLMAQRARALSRVGQWDAAAEAMRAALATRPSYTFYARMQRLIDEIAGRAEGTVRQARIAVLGSATTSLLIPVLRALCFRDRIDAAFHEGAFGAFRQEILERDGVLAAFKPTVVIIAPHWRDLELPSLGAGEPQAAAAIVDGYRALWSAVHAISDCHVIQHTFDLPADDSAGLLSVQLAAGRRRLIRRINLGLADALSPGVSLLDTEQVAAEVGTDRWSNPRLWYLARQHPSSDALPELAEEQIAHLRAALGLSRKVLVCDLDNTLWKGVIGEDGLDGIKAGPGSPDGEAYADLQRYIRDLKDRGVVLAVCSKNNLEDAQAPFRGKSGMALGLDDFAVFKANWDDKAENVRRIAAEIGVGLDSLVVIDDNPFERAWIRSQLPRVAVPELGASVFTYVRDLDRGRYFPAIAWSPEDRLRADGYRREQERATARENAGNLEDFLAGLHMRGTCEPVTDANIERVTQLTNKTNQFNLTTRRRTLAEVRHLAAISEGWTGVFSLQDRYGDYGIIGLLFCVPGAGAASWDIDTWLMSCRVLRRDVEKFMLDCLVDAARAAGIANVRGRYLRTEKNAQVVDLFASLGFETVSRTDDEGRYELRVDSVTSPFSAAIAREGRHVSLAQK